MRTRTSGSWTLTLAVALLAGMTSTLTAQAAESKSGPTSVSPAAGSAGSAGFVDSGSKLSGQGAVAAVPLTTGTCGTVVDKPPHVQRLHARMHLIVLATTLYKMTPYAPGHPAIRPLLYRLWLQSTIDVLPPS